MKQQMKDLLVSDRKMLRGLDPVKAILFLCARHTLLPEIFDAFGKEDTLSFLEIFGGRTIKVPSVKAVKDALVALTIWEEMSKSKDKGDTCKILAKRFSVRASEIRASYTRVEEMLNGQETLATKGKSTAKSRCEYLKADSRKRTRQKLETAQAKKSKPKESTEGTQQNKGKAESQKTT